MIDIDDLVGVPFVDGGRDLSGFDCQGAIILGFARFGKVLPDYQISCVDHAAIHRRAEASRTMWEVIDAPEVPCLITFRTNPAAPDMITHFGVYVGDGKFLHATQVRGCSVLERIDNPLYRNRIEGFYRYAG